jgi:hypothetical protein
VRGNASRALLPAFVVLALVGVVAIASTGSTPGGTNDARPPAESLIDTILSLFLVLLVPAAAILIYGLAQRKAIAREIASGRYRRTGLFGFIVSMAILGGFVYWRLRDWQRAPFEDEIGETGFPGNLPTPGPVPPSSGETTYEPEFAWVPMLVVLGLVAIGIGAAVVASRRRTTEHRDEEAIAQAIAAVLDDTLDDLRAEKDARRAVIAAYARLERVLAAHRRPRRAAETPEEYLRRILPLLEIDPRSIRRLTELFTRAKFSRHVVDSAMKDEAIAALSTVRDELQAAMTRRVEQMQAMSTAPEHA